MTDRRSETSRANLGDHIPQALDPNGTTVVATRLPQHAANLLAEKAAAQGITRSELIRRIIEDQLPLIANL